MNNINNLLIFIYTTGVYQLNFYYNQLFIIIIDDLAVKIFYESQYSLSLQIFNCVCTIGKPIKS